MLMIEDFLICRTFHIVEEYENIKDIKEKILFNSFVVVKNIKGDFAGILSPQDFIKKAHILAGDCISERVKVNKTAMLEEVLEMLNKSEYNELPVFENNRFYGVICKNTIVDFLNMYTKKLAQEIDNKTEELIKLNNIKDTLFSIIGHDLRSPLSQIIGFTEILKKKFYIQDKKKTWYHINLINFAAVNVLEMTDNLLFWAMSQKNLLKLNCVEINFKEFLIKEIETYQFVVEHKGINIDYSVDKNIFLFADLTMIRIIIRNIISNAIKFVEKGKGKININVISQDQFIDISVSDNGIGMTEKTKNEIFGTNIHSIVGTNNEKGMGIGLRICRELVEKHGGKIQVHSLLKKGTKISILIPFSHK